jgi:hypothetical protein
MSSTSPWDEILVPSTDYNVRLVADARTVPIFWGRDAKGAYLLIVELTGDYSAEFNRQHAPVHGIHVDLRDGDTAGAQLIVLTLDRGADRDLFQALCGTLIDSIAALPDSRSAFTMTLTHLRRWKAFMTGRKMRVLRPEEVRGLFAELHVLRALYAHRLSQAGAVEAWCGVDAVHQDFIFGNCAVEVKSLVGRDRNTVRISSEDQLATVMEELFLVVCHLSQSEVTEAALSLNGLVQVIEQELIDGDALSQFTEKLAAFGYVPIHHYDEPRFLVTSRQAYRVTEKFPRLIRSALPTGIARLSYEIEIEAITGFECSEREVLGGK